MDWISQLLDLFLHLDAHLNEWAGWLGPWLYVVLFVIVLCETGLVITPILPGDSLLFAVGALASIEQSPLSLPLILVLLIGAAIAGDAVNYAIGRWAGPKVFTKRESRLFNTEHLHRAHRFYEQYGGKAIFLARFIPIIRTFAPFVAGIGTMSYRRFAVFNVTGAVAWVGAFVLGGYRFGRVPAVQRNFHYVILAIVILSMVPLVVEYVRARARHAE